MRKFIKIFVALVLFASLKIYVYAAPEDPDGYLNNPIYTALENTVNETWGYPLNDSAKKHLWDYGFNPQDNYYLVLVKYPNNLNYYMSNDVVINNSIITMPTGSMMITYTNGTADYSTLSNYQITINDNTQIIGYYNDITIDGTVYDWSIPNFEADLITSIVTDNSNPQIGVKFRYTGSGGGGRGSDTQRPNPYLNYYVQVKASFVLAEEFKISGTGSNKIWNVTNAQSTGYIDVYDFEDRQRVTDTSYSAGTYNYYDLDMPMTITEWTDLYNTAVQNNLFDFDWNTLVFNPAQKENQYINNNAKLAGVQFNSCDLWVRFYTVDSGQIRVGSWTHFNNDQWSIEQAPFDTIDVIPLYPPTGISILPPDDGDNIIDNDLTDPNLLPSININNTVNYPDQNTMNYPTITTYNQDHLLKYAIDTSKQLPSLFESITAFCQVAFAFIPAEIWTLIGFGFALSIVVMFMKVL